MPFRLLNGDSDSLRYFTIVAESCEAFNRIKEVYISYDIEIGEDRIIMNNIHYKRKLEIEYRPKIW